MIELKITGCCRSCKHIDLRLDYIHVDFGRSYFLTCIHAPTCIHLDQERKSAAKDDYLKELLGVNTVVGEKV